MTQATLQIKIWTQGRGKRLPDDCSDIANLFAPHAEHVASMCRGGYQAGEIVDDKFAGWWSMDVETKPKPTEAELIDALGTLLSEYGDIDEMLDNFSASGPEGMNSDEAKRQRESNKARDKIQKLYHRAIG
jgi:hypothetical protein